MATQLGFLFFFLFDVNANLEQMNSFAQLAN